MGRHKWGVPPTYAGYLERPQIFSQQPALERAPVARNVADHLIVVQRDQPRFAHGQLVAVHVDPDLFPHHVEVCFGKPLHARDEFVAALVEVTLTLQDDRPVVRLHLERSGQNRCKLAGVETLTNKSHDVNLPFAVLSVNLRRSFAGGLLFDRRIKSSASHERFG